MLTLVLQRSCAIIVLAMALPGCTCNSDPQLPFTPDAPDWVAPRMRWYGGVDGGNWLELLAQTDSTYVLNLYASDGSVEWSNRLTIERGVFDTARDYRFLYPTDYTVCTIEQGGDTITLLPDSGDLTGSDL